MDLQLRRLLQLQILFLADHVFGNGMPVHVFHNAIFRLQGVRGSRGSISDVSPGFWPDTHVLLVNITHNVLGFSHLACEQIHDNY